MISAVILTRNNQKTIVQVLNALKGFNEVIIYDTGSSDETLNLAQKFANVKIIKGMLNGFGNTRNLAASLAKNDWILSIDSDEVLSSQLAEEILNTGLNSSTVYSLPFHNYFNNRLIKWCGWYPEEHIRLYYRHSTRFSDAMVHEGVVVKNVKIKKLINPVKHYPYRTISDFLSKMQIYSDLFAIQNQGKRPSSIATAIGHGMGAFMKSYLLKKGFLGGYEGFIISIYNGHTAFYKYMKLYEANRYKKFTK